MIAEPYKGDKNLSYELGQILINKVVDILEDEKIVQEIIEDTKRDTLDEKFYKALSNCK